MDSALPEMLDVRSGKRNILRVTATANRPNTPRAFECELGPNISQPNVARKPVTAYRTRPHKHAHVHIFQREQRAAQTPTTTRHTNG